MRIPLIRCDFIAPIKLQGPNVTSQGNAVKGEPNEKNPGPNQVRELIFDSDLGVVMIVTYPGKEIWQPEHNCVLHPDPTAPATLSRAAADAKADAKRAGK